MPFSSQNISFYKGPITNLTPESSISLQQLVALVKSDTYRILCTGIRQSADKKHISGMKKKLDYVTVAGTFTRRDASQVTSVSGLMVIDFDDVQYLGETIELLKTDKHVAALFISPGGRGLKSVIQIDIENNADLEKNYKRIFADASLYFQNEYKLVPDASGSDICRACFLSFDPDAYLNESASIYTYRGYRSVKKETFKPEKKAEISRLEQVVKQITEAGIDITGDYSSEWLLIAFSLSTYGEPGRYYFHEVSRQNPAYDQQATDDKFNNALQTSRFTNPAKFFKIAEDYGIDCTLRQAQGTKQVPVDNLKPEMVYKPEVKDPTEVKKKREELEIQTVWYYTDTYTITIKSGRSYKQVCDCLIFVKYKTEDEWEEITWVLESRMPDQSIFIELPHEDFCSASKLKRHFASKSISLRITDNDLSELHGYLFTKTYFHTALKVVRFGWNPDTKSYLFSNVIWHDGELEAPDEFGIVKVSLPSVTMSEVEGSRGQSPTDQTTKNLVFLSMPNPKGSLKKRHELTDLSVSFEEFKNTYLQAFGYELGFVPLCFYIFSIFRDIAVKEKSFSPILFLKGGAGTGKSSMIRVLTAAFGRKQEGVNLKSKNTEASLVKIMSQTSNAIIWFDEFHNDFPHEGILQAAYDNDGYHRSSDTNSIETNSVEIHSALALTSNYLPDNPIFFSRTLFIPITNNQKTDEQRAAFFKLQQWQDLGLGCLTVEILAGRAFCEQNYLVAYKELFEEFRERFGKMGLPERLMTNMAQTMVFAYMLEREGRIKLTGEHINKADGRAQLDEYIRIGAEFIDRQFRIMNESKAIAEFWEIIQQKYDQGWILPDQHYRIKGQAPNREIHINFSKMYNVFAPAYRQVFTKTAPDRDTIQTEMALANGNYSWEEISKPIRFMQGAEDKHEGKSIPIKNSCTINYDILQRDFGVDFESRKATNL